MFASVKRTAISVLRWSEKYLKTDMVYFGRGGFWLSTGSVAGSAALFLLSIAFANLIPVETYGAYRYVLSIVSILLITSLSGIDTAVTQAVARGNEGAMYTGLKTKIRWGLVGTLGAIVIAAYYLISGNETMGFSFLLAAPFIPFYETFSIYVAYLQGKQRFKISSIYSVITQAVTAMTLIATLYVTDNVVLILLAYFAVRTVVNTVLFRRTMQKLPPNERDDGRTISYGKHLSLIKGLGTASGSISQILLYHLLGGSGLAIFALAIAPIEQIRSLLRLVENLLFPKVAHDQWQLSNIRSFFKKIAPFLAIIAVGVAFYIILAPLIYRTFFPQYLASVGYSQVYATSLILTALLVVFSGILKAKRKIREQHIMNALDISLNLFVSLPLVYFYGIAGLIFSIILIKFVEVAVLLILLFQRQYPQPA